MSLEKSAEQKRRDEMLAIIRDPKNWMSSSERAELEKELISKKPADREKAVDLWLMLRFKQTREEFLVARRMTKQPNPKTIKRPTPLSPENTIHQKMNGGRKKSELELLGRYSFLSKTGKKLTITKVSRNFSNYEESRLHRNSSCEFIDECIDYAIELKINCFSCLNCDQKNDRSALY